MGNMLKYAATALLVVGLTACDDAANSKDAVDNGASNSQSVQSVSLPDGKLSFSLPAGMSDRSGKLGTQANNMHVYADESGQRAIIIIVADTATEELEVLAKRLEQQQHERDPQLQVVSNRSLTINGKPAQELTTVITANQQTSWSSVVLVATDDKLITMQITLPADNQQQAQNEAEKVISSLQLQ